jgi:nucleoside-diphosphate-sugar epimerase
VVERLDPSSLPERFEDEAGLEEFLSRPGQALVDDMARLEGDILVLGVGGKMGPTLAHLAKRAAPGKRVVGVARFSEPGLRERLESQDIETIQCDLLRPEAVAELPRLANVVFMAGRKFGSTGAEELTWAMNTWVPTLVAERFRDSRIVAFSTGNVYPFAPVGGPAPTEATAPGLASGEYGASCLGRERLFEYFSGLHGTPGRIIRLNYAIEMRYGILYDVASKVRSGRAIDLTMGHVNVIWQGDANAQALRALLHCSTPTSPLNVSGPETLSVRQLARSFAERLDREPVFTGAEAATALLTDAGLAARLFGPPVVALERAVEWTADWVARDMPSLDKPTHYGTRDGKF